MKPPTNLVNAPVKETKLTSHGWGFGLSGDKFLKCLRNETAYSRTIYFISFPHSKTDKNVNDCKIRLERLS